MRRWKFSPPLWATALTLAACAVALSLSYWQWQRSEAKAKLLDDYLQAATAAPVPFAEGRAASAQPLHVKMRGEYLPERQLFLDNQAYQQKPGLHVWTPLKLNSGALVLVNRGWIAQFPRRDQASTPPAPQGTVEISGYWRELPRAGLPLPAPACGPAERFPQFVVYPQQTELECLLARPVLQGVLLLSAQAEGGFVRDWSFSDVIPPERHIGYALQWAAIAMAIFAIYLKLNLKLRM